MSELQLREVSPESAEYHELLALRFRELREPLGMIWTEAEMASDQEDRHFGLHDGTAWAGVVVACDLGGGEYKLRQIAVCRTRQGQGVGRRLMKRVEDQLGSDGAKEFQLNARLTVAGFYEAIGYRPVGETFEEIGIPHVKMRKTVTAG